MQLAPQKSRIFHLPLCVVLFVVFEAASFANIPGGGTGTGANVTLTSTSTTATLSNGIVSILCTKSGAVINQINYTYNNGSGTKTKQLLAGGKNGGQLYWEYGGYGNGGTWTYAVVVDPAVGDATHAAGDYAEIALTCNAVGTAQVGDLQVNFSMRRGSPGFYVTLTMKHHAGNIATGLGEMRTNIYFAPDFNWMSVTPTIQRELGIGATYAPAFFAPVECSLCTSGVNQGVYDDKYKFSALWGDERVWGWSSVNDAAHGVASGTNIGMWYALASTEYYNGGPMKPELMDAPMVNMLNGGHYYMGNDSNWTADENWTRVQGPFFIYLNNVSNTITDPVQASTALYNDAVAQGAAEATAWPYSWFNNPTYDSNYIQAAQRGTVTGKMVINDSYNPNASAANLWVGVIQQTATITTAGGVVQQTASTDGVYDFQQWYKPYQFWVKTDANGNFSIPNVIAGNNYTLYAFGPGAAGTFLSQNLTGGNPPLLYNLPATPFAVTVTGGATTALGNVTWTPTRVGPTVFEIGYPDRTAKKFRHGDDWWVGDIGPSPTTPSPIWTKFLEFPFDYPSGLNYTVGTSRWPTDWNFIQPIIVDTLGNDTSSSSTITFNLPAVPTSGTASLYLGIASDYYSAVVVNVNGTTLASSGTITATPNTLPASGFIPAYTHSDGSIREQANGSFSDERITFPVSTQANSLLHAGTNTITLSQRQVGGAYFANHFMYDYIRLEMTGYVPPPPASVTAYAGSNSALVCWPVTPGATSYKVLRSTTSGGGYSLLAGASNVVGPVSGSGPGNASYLDTTAVNGTPYYYVVQAVNPTGTSANSPQSAAVTPLASAPTTAPAAPTSLSTTVSNGSVTLNWTAAPGANFYTVLRSTLVDKIPNYAAATALSSNNTILSTITLSNSVTGTSFTDNSVTNGTKYAYTVLATNAVGTSSTSTATVAKPSGTAPGAAPSGVTATPGAQQIALKWSAVPGAVGYVIQVGTKSGGPYTYVSSVSTLTYTDSGQADDTTYYYVITAMNAGGVSVNSTEVSATTAPAAPTGLTATAGNTQVQLAWTASKDATSYIVRRGTVSGTYTNTFTTTGPSYVDSGLTNGTTYYYVVAASNATSGTGVDSAEVSATPVTTVSVAPLNLTATAGNAQVVLNWSASSGATSYTIKRGTANGGPYSTTVASGVTSTTYSNTGLTNGTTYYYVVLAVNSGGSSTNSTQASATPAAPPVAPTALTATAGNAQVVLNWNAASGATSYSVLRSTVSGSGYAAVNSNISGTTFTDTGLSNGTTYYYVVTATNVGGTSANSTQASAKPVQTFSQWIAAAFPGQSDTAIIGNTADPDHDGVKNLVEYFLGTNPALGDASGAVTSALDGQGNIVMTFRMAKNLTGATYSVDQSADLLHWTSTGLQGSVVSDQGTYYLMKVSVPMGSNPKLFLRLSITPGP